MSQTPARRSRIPPAGVIFNRRKRRHQRPHISRLQTEDRWVQFQVPSSIISPHINNPEVTETLKMSLFDAAHEISTCDGVAAAPFFSPEDQVVPLVSTRRWEREQKRDAAEGKPLSSVNRSLLTFPPIFRRAAAATAGTGT